MRGTIGIVALGWAVACAPMDVVEDGEVADGYDKEPSTTASKGGFATPVLASLDWVWKTPGPRADPRCKQVTAPGDDEVGDTGAEPSEAGELEPSGEIPEFDGSQEIITWNGLTLECLSIHGNSWDDTWRDLANGPLAALAAGDLMNCQSN
ncbi:MAG: hypothetical protein AAGC55_27625 [Myxococcota bacterium]